MRVHRFLVYGAWLLMLGACSLHAPMRASFSLVPVAKVASAPAAAVDQAVLVTSDSQAVRGYQLSISRDGHYTLTPGGASATTGSVDATLATRFFNDLDAAAPLAHLPPTQCTKSNYFGFVTTVSYRGARTPDLSCTTCNAAVAAIANDATALYAQATYAPTPPSSSPLPRRDRVAVTLTPLLGLGVAGTADGDATQATFTRPGPLAFTSTGLWLLDADHLREVTGLAGTPKLTTLGASTAFNSPQGLALDLQGNLVVADTGNRKLLRVSPTGSVSTLATTLAGPTSLAVDAAGRIALVDGERLRVFDPSTQALSPPGVTAHLVAAGPQGTWILATATAVYTLSAPDATPKLLAGGAAPGVDDGLGAMAGFTQLDALAVDAAGRIYLADANKLRVCEPTGQVRTLGVDPAGVGEPCAGDTGGATLLSSPQGLALDAQGDLLVADTGHQRLVRVHVQAPV